MLTFVTDEIYLLALFRDADGVVLHPRTSPNVSKHQNLNMLVVWVLRGLVLRGDGIASLSHQPGAEDVQIPEEEHTQTSSDRRQGERYNHCEGVLPERNRPEPSRITGKQPRRRCASRSAAVACVVRTSGIHWGGKEASGGQKESAPQADCSGKNTPL